MLLPLTAPQPLIVLPPHYSTLPYRAARPLPGEGVMIYASGGRYEGQWEYGRPHGASSLLYPYPYPYP